MKKLFNKKVFLLFITLSIGIYWVIQYFRPVIIIENNSVQKNFRPVIIIENNSAQKIYIFSVQGHNLLVTPGQITDEYSHVVRLVKPKSTLLFYPWFSLLKNNNNEITIEISLKKSPEQTHFLKSFRLRSDKGYCRTKIVVNDDESYVVHDDNVWLCLKKIHVITDEERKDIMAVIGLRLSIKKQVSPEHYEKIMQKVDESREFVTTEIFLNIVREVTK